MIDINNPSVDQFTRDNIIAYRTGVEGGYVNNSNDLGGETNHGITKATALQWQSLWAKYNWNGDMRTLPTALAYDMYVAGWWNPLRLDDVANIHPVLCDRLFDWGINAGRQRGVFALQDLLNVCNRQQRDYKDIGVDGAMGPGTLGALQSFVNVRGKAGLRYLINTHSSMQNSYYVDISKARQANEEFTNGWLQRGYDNATLLAGLIVKGIL
jgi:lysozyme family protein